MPELLTEGLPERKSRSKFDFSRWADGQAWKFVRGEDYESSTETFRANVMRWAAENGYEVTLRAYPAIDRDGAELPMTKADPLALEVACSSATARRRRRDTDRVMRSSRRQL